MRLHVGCAMWQHPAWLGRFVSRALPARERLRSYAKWCNAVEGNSTFYAIPHRDTVATWAQQTDPDFRFVVKLPKVITHGLRLRHPDEALRQFLAAIEPLGPRVHALWVQLPGSFGPHDISALAGFLRRLPNAYRHAVEVRHPAFFNDRRAAHLLERVLDAATAEWVPFDTTRFFQHPPTSEAERECWERKPRLPLRSHALTDQPIVRYLGRDDLAQTMAGWRHWVDLTAQWLREGRSPTIFIHTPDNTAAPMLARRFHEQVAALVPGLAPLPTPQVEVETPTLF